MTRVSSFTKPHQKPIPTVRLLVTLKHNLVMQLRQNALKLPIWKMECANKINVPIFNMWRGTVKQKLQLTKMVILCKYK